MMQNIRGTYARIDYEGSTFQITLDCGDYNTASLSCVYMGFRPVNTIIIMDSMLAHYCATVCDALPLIQHRVNAP